MYATMWEFCEEGVIVDRLTLEMALESEETTAMTPNLPSVRSHCTIWNPQERKYAHPGSLQANPCIHLAQVELRSVVHPSSFPGMLRLVAIGEHLLAYISLRLGLSCLRI